ncbi:hypothetical protein J3R82DRAFT_10552 [Butyriboletus roseoflavus]|nr:hypothetical protein J3R82DRAFT_10552 [Butyriboletus roseoflavus]
MTTTTQSPAAFLLNIYNWRHSDLIGHPDSIAPTETAWHNNVRNWNFLAGITQSEVMARHSMPNLLSSWTPKGQKQIIGHHFFPNNAICASEGTLLAGYNILKFLNSIKVDVAHLQDALITAHDFKTTHTIFRDEPIQWEQLTYDEIKGEPIIMHEVDRDRLSPKFQVTLETITKMDEYIVFFIQCNPNVTIFLDCRNEDAAPTIALLSHLPFAYKNCVIKLYAYSFSSAQELIAAVEQYQPDQA